MISPCGLWPVAAFSGFFTEFFLSFEDRRDGRCNRSV